MDQDTSPDRLELRRSANHFLKLKQIVSLPQLLWVVHAPERNSLPTLPQITWIISLVHQVNTWIDLFLCSVTGALPGVTRHLRTPPQEKSVKNVKPESHVSLCLCLLFTHPLYETLNQSLASCFTFIKWGPLEGRKDCDLTLSKVTRVNNSISASPRESLFGVPAHKLSDEWDNGCVNYHDLVILLSTHIPNHHI